MDNNRIKYLIIIGSAIILFVTNPKFDSHKEKINQSINENIKDGIVKSISKMTTSFSINNLNLLRYRNYYLISITTFELDRNVRVSSMGILGNIFVFKEEIKKNIIAFGNDINESIKRTFEAKKKKDAEAIEAIKKYKNIF